MTFPIGGAGSYENVLSIHSDLIKPHFLMSAYEEHGEQYNTMLNLQEMLGNRIAVPSDSYSAFFSGWKTFPITTVGNVAGTGVGNSCIITLSSADHTGTLSYPRVGWKVLIPGKNYAEARIMSKDVTTDAHAHKLTLEPLSSTQEIGAIASGTQLFITSSAKPTGSGQAGGVNTDEIKRSFTLQIQEENWQADGHKLVEPTWTKILDNNKEHAGIVSREIADAEFRLDKGRGFAWWLGEENTNDLVMDSAEALMRGTATGGSHAVTSTKGVFRWINGLGGTASVGAGSLAWSHITAIKDHFISEAVGCKYAMIVGGHKRIQEISDLVFTKNQGNATDYTAKQVNSMLGLRGKQGLKVREGLSAMFDFKSFTLGNITYFLVEIADFSDPRSLGISGYGWENYAVVIPITTTKAGTISGKRDKIVSNTGIAYLKNMGYDRGMEIWHTGAANGIYTNTQDIKAVHYRAHEGAWIGNANQGYIFTD